MSIFDLPSLVHELPDHHQAIWNRIYKYSILYGRVELVSGIRNWVKEQFGSEREVENQKIMRVTNLITSEGALFNHLRGMRPQTCRPEQDLTCLVEESRQSCPFCSPEEHTPQDPFGRIQGKYCLTAANLAKYDEYHGLIISREHHPLSFNREMVEDYFRVAAQWFNEVKTYHGRNSLLYPFLMWNCLWPAASSVVHGHLQMTVTQECHYPKVEQLQKYSLEYLHHFGRDYFQDLFILHQALGLGWEVGKARLLVTLTPVKEKEVFIMLPPGPVTPNRLGLAGKVVYAVLDILKDKTCLNSFNLAVYLPPIEEKAANWSSFPLIARLVDRGSVFNRTADFGAMEIFAASVITSDPFTIAEMLKRVNV